MSRVLFITHPEVEVDPGLTPSEVGADPEPAPEPTEPTPAEDLE